MDCPERTAAKAASQAWRKKPRKFAPKSRLGCKTCKYGLMPCCMHFLISMDWLTGCARIRRVKCDLSRPSCQKCQSTGRTCDGYAELQDHSVSQKGPMQLQKHNSCISKMASNPTLTLPTATPLEGIAMDFFQHVSIRTMDEYRPSDLWRNSLMLFAQTVPVVRHAALALAIMHRTHLDALQQVKSKPLSSEPGQDALFHYHKAIQLLLQSGGSNTSEPMVTTLLVCYLFVCFGNLSGKGNEAIVHLQGGLALSSNLGSAAPTKNNPLSFDTDILSQVSNRLQRLNLQAAIFITDWTEADIVEDRLCDEGTAAFTCLNQAIDAMQVLMSRTMRLHHNTTEFQLSSNKVPELTLPNVPARDALLTQLSTWLQLFKGMPRHAEMDESSPAVLLLHLHYMIARVLLYCQQAGREMLYDDYLADFQKCAGIIDQLTTIHNTQSPTLLYPIWSPEIGIIPVLYIIGAKCRDSVVRRHVLRLLRRRPMREAVWDNLTTAKTVEKIIDIEEMSMQRLGVDCLPLSYRIESVSMLYSGIGQAGTLMTFSYKFCMQDTVHIEELIV